MPASLVRVARSVLVATAATILLVAPVAAKEPVDPDTLNPPPPAEFNPACERLGGSIVCDLAFSDPPVDQPSELFCDGDQIFESWDSVGRRQADLRREGNLLKRQFREDFVGTFTNPIERSDGRLGHPCDEYPRSRRPGRRCERHLVGRWPVDPDHRTRR